MFGNKSKNKSASKTGSGANGKNEAKVPRGALKFAEKFEKLRLAYKSAEDDAIDDVLADAAALLKSSQSLCEYFLMTCGEDQLRFARVFLDEVADHYASESFLDAIKQAQMRFPKYDLTSAMDAAAYAVVQAEYDAATKKERAADRARILAELRAKAKAGDPEAQYLYAVRLYVGIDGTPCFDEACKWAKLAAENGCVKAEIFRDLPRN